MLENFEIYYYLEFDRLHKGILTEETLEEVWQMAVDKYTYINDENIDITDEIDRMKVHNWFRNNARDEMLNDLLCGVVKRLTSLENDNGMELNNIDSFFLNNIKLIYELVLTEEDYLLNTMDNNPCEVSKITGREVKLIIEDILEEIDSTGEWLEIYLKAIATNHIIYLNELDDASLTKLKNGLGIVGFDNFDNTCVYLGNQDRYLFLNYQGDLMDVIFTIHEVIHYINETVDNGREVPPIIHEFPSIFYEMYALKYLIKMGYSDAEIMKVYYNRQIDTLTCINEVKEIINYLSLYISNGEVHILPNDDRGDKCIKKLINNPYVLFMCYPYIIGEYLARHAIHQSEKDNLFLSMMKYITNNLSKVPVEDIFNLIDRKETYTRVKI